MFFRDMFAYVIILARLTMVTVAVEFAKKATPMSTVNAVETLV